MLRVTNSKLRTAMVGWRGMVGSVLMQRMEEENDFSLVEPTFFSTSQAGSPAPRGEGLVRDAMDLDALSGFEVVLTCQGGSYTEAVYRPLRERGWKGVWIDAASTLRQAPESVIVLDPVNRSQIEQALTHGPGEPSRCFVGGNCTVSLMLMAVAPLLRAGQVQWVNSVTYQAVSGAGAAAVLEMVGQTRVSARAVELEMAAVEAGRSPAPTALRLAEIATNPLRGAGLCFPQLGAPIASNVLPWIDRLMDSGQTREEWKGFVEANKILGLDPPIPVDGTCVRVPNFRCHSQALTLKVAEGLSVDAIEEALRGSHQWLDFVPNEREQSLERLTPAAVEGSLRIAVGRLRRLQLGEDLVTLFTVGDQLLWGAAEPLRRMLRILTERDWFESTGRP